MKSNWHILIKFSVVCWLALLAACAAPSATVEATARDEATPSPAPTTVPSPIPLSTASTSKPLAAGLRASSYGIRPFPSPEWWVAASQDMAARYNNAQPVLVWIVGVVGENGEIWLNFPADGPAEDPYLRFADSDFNQAYLTAFDQAGVKVWLQVEPGQADVAGLIDIVLDRYGQHPSVAGFGVDVEWYRQDEYEEGKAVSDTEAKLWHSRVQAYNPDYTLFLKHWLTEKMPHTYRDGILFVDDSQDFDSMVMMVDEFETWGEYFAPAPVAYQFGYQSDQPWWGDFEDPPLEIGDILFERVPNLGGLFWVDFTAAQLWPPP